jgi:alkylated DNA nucleotide flippase Atl1
VRRSDVLSVGDERLEERVVAQASRHRHRDRADAGDLAHLAGLHVAAHECGVVDPDDDRRFAPWLRHVPTRGIIRQSDQRIERERLRALAPSCCVPGGLEELALVGSSAAITRAVASTGPRTSMRPVPSGSCQERTDRRCRIDS